MKREKGMKENNVNMKTGLLREISSQILTKSHAAHTSDSNCEHLSVLMC